MTQLADEVIDPGLRDVLQAFADDAEMAQMGRTVPCTRNGHHAYLGGLIEHSVGVAMLCQSLCTWHPRVDSDLLVAAALCFKRPNAEAVPRRRYTPTGRLWCGFH